MSLRINFEAVVDKIYNKLLKQSKKLLKQSKRL